MSEISRNGRSIAVPDLIPDGPADASVVLLCHLAPGSGTFDPDPGATAAHAVRLVGVDRPGYGGSAPLEDAFATIGGAADDAAAVLTAMLPVGATAGVAGCRRAAGSRWPSPRATRT